MLSDLPESTRPPRAVQTRASAQGPSARPPGPPAVLSGMRPSTRLHALVLNAIPTRRCQCDSRPWRLTVSSSDRQSPGGLPIPLRCPWLGSLCVLFCLRLLYPEQVIASFQFLSFKLGATDGERMRKATARESSL